MEPLVTETTDVCRAEASRWAGRRSIYPFDRAVRSGDGEISAAGGRFTWHAQRENDGEVLRAACAALQDDNVDDACFAAGGRMR